MTHYTALRQRAVRLTRMQPEDPEELEQYWDDLAVELYLQGRTTREVAVLMEWSTLRVSRAIHEARVQRKDADAYRLALDRVLAVAQLNKINIKCLALWWLDGVEPEFFSIATGVPADLLIDAILAEVAKPPKESPHTTARCVRRACTNGCVMVCAVSGPQQQREDGNTHDCATTTEAGH